MGWIITALILICLALIPLGVKLSYQEAQFCVIVRAGFMTFRVFPGKKKEKTEAHQSDHKKKKTKEAPEKPPREEAEKPAMKVKDYLPMVKTALSFLGELRRKLRVKLLSCRISLAGGDPADLAVNYGRTWTAIGNLMPQLERCFRIARRDVQVNCNFLDSQTVIEAVLDIRITFGRVLSLLVRYGCKLIIQYMKQMKLSKGGAEA